MDVMDIIKNPVVIGLLAGLITYMYMRWKNDSDKDNKDKKKKKDINLLIPFSVFIVFWFISYAIYFSNEEESEKPEAVIAQAVIEQTGAPNKINLTKNNDINIKIKPTKVNTSETSDPVSFNMVSNGVHIPTSLPNILFEMN